jgi:hypothetical protein
MHPRSFLRGFEPRNDREHRGHGDKKLSSLHGETIATPGIGSFHKDSLGSRALCAPAHSQEKNTWTSFCGILRAHALIHGSGCVNIYLPITMGDLDMPERQIVSL